MLNRALGAYSSLGRGIDAKAVPVVSHQGAGCRLSRHIFSPDPPPPVLTWARSLSAHLLPLCTEHAGEAHRFPLPPPTLVPQLGRATLSSVPRVPTQRFVPRGLGNGPWQPGPAGGAPARRLGNPCDECPRSASPSSWQPHFNMEVWEGWHRTGFVPTVAPSSPQGTHGAGVTANLILSLAELPLCTWGSSPRLFRPCGPERHPRGVWARWAQQAQSQPAFPRAKGP